jgi:orotate phosphoribosyltransferase
MYDRARLAELITQRALRFGEFTLASGKKADYYLDCRQVTLDGEGAHLIGLGIVDLLQADWPAAVGGLAIGADPITAAVILAAWQRGRRLCGFMIRKEPKAHGLGRAVEGPIAAGLRGVIVEDIATTGGSIARAASQARAAGLVIDRAIAVVDRLEGARQALADNGIALQSLFTIRDLGIASR